MIRPGERLEKIAERLKDCKTMADIGTDHGFLPAYLVERGVCESAIASDISMPSLEKAINLCRELGVGNIETRQGDGLAVLKSGEVEGIVIAGMGGKLISEIMSENMEHTYSFMKFVLQPRSAIGELRKWLLDNGFAIVGEDVVHEGKFMPEIITARPPGKMKGSETNLAEGVVLPEREICYQLPPWMLRAEGPVRELVRRIEAREERVLAGLLEAKERDEDKVRDKREDISYLRDILRELEEER